MQDECSRRNPDRGSADVLDDNRYRVPVIDCFGGVMLIATGPVLIGQLPQSEYMIVAW